MVFLEEAVDHINEKMDALSSEKNVVLWGAGENAVRLLQYTKLLTLCQLCIVDKRLHGQIFFGQIVRKPEDILWETIDVVVISAFVGTDEIRMELEEKYAFKGLLLSIHENLKVPFYKLIQKKNSIWEEYMIPVLQRNNEYKNIHEGERVFILCTGPSISEMELTRLKDEKTIAVSGFYLHKDCQVILPDYYCAPTFEKFLSPDLAAEYLRAIQKATPHTRHFFSIREKQVIDKMREYEEGCVNYIAFVNMSSYDAWYDIDLTGLTPSPQSVAVMALEMALYMGFGTIYLLGTEHDCLITKQYMHFYDYNESIVSQNNKYENVQGSFEIPFSQQLASTYNLWEQYKQIKRIAEEKGTKIYNATKSGILDVFERVDFDTLF